MIELYENTTKIIQNAKLKRSKKERLLGKLGWSELEIVYLLKEKEKENENNIR